eukprot:scaffold114424_cov20-Tisochrysis_lutea.AAC.1
MLLVPAQGIPVLVRIPSSYCKYRERGLDKIKIMQQSRADASSNQTNSTHDGYMPTLQALQSSASLHSPSMDMQNTITSVHTLLMPLPIRWHSTLMLHSRAKCRPIMERIPVLATNLASSTKTVFSPAIDGFHL